MNHKKWFNWTVLACIWLFITSFLYALIGSVLIFGTEEGKTMLQRFVNDELNTVFMYVFSLGSVMAVSIVCTMIMSLSKKASKLDRLDEEIEKYYNARVRLDRKIREL